MGDRVSRSRSSFSKKKERRACPPLLIKLRRRVVAVSPERESQRSWSARVLHVLPLLGDLPNRPELDVRKRGGSSRLPFLQEPGGFVCGCGSAEEKALAETAAELAQVLRLPGLLDSLSHGREAERAAEAKDRVDERPVCVLADELVDEGFRNLQRLDRELRQAAQRTSTPCPKSSIVKLTPRSRRRRIATSARSLPWMTADSVTSITTRLGSTPNRSSDSASVSTSRSFASSAGAMFSQMLSRSGQLRAASRACSEHEAPELDDQTGLLGSREELAGGEQATSRVRPPRQNLEAFDLTVCQPHHRLVVGDELLAFDRTFEIEPELSLGAKLLVQLRLVEGVSALRPLAAVHRDVGVAEEILGRHLQAAADTDADAHMAGDVAAFERIGAIDVREDPLDSGHRLVGSGVADEDCELVAADSRSEVLGTKRVR